LGQNAGHIPESWRGDCGHAVTLPFHVARHQLKVCAMLGDSKTKQKGRGNKAG
jgi:hypothetical protein